MWSYLFTAAHLITLVILLWRRYYRSFPIFCGYLAALTWQCGVVANMRPGWSRAVWYPGEWVCLGLALAGGIEAVWKGLRDIGPLRRWFLLGAISVFAGGIAYATWRPFEGDWFSTFLSDRVYINLGLATLACWGTIVALHINWAWARVGRMHGCLYASLMAFHTLFGGMGSWENNRLYFRISACLCLAGWLINSHFLVGERAESSRAPRGVSPLPGAARLPALRVGQGVLPTD